jgi:hypothetical protein
VDEENTAGFNTSEDTAMIAVYTLHQNATGIQQQAISIIGVTQSIKKLLI